MTKDRITVIVESLGQLWTVLSSISVGTGSETWNDSPKTTGLRQRQSGAVLGRQYWGFSKVEPVTKFIWRCYFWKQFQRTLNPKEGCHLYLLEVYPIMQAWYSGSLTSQLGCEGRSYWFHFTDEWAISYLGLLSQKPGLGLNQKPSSCHWVIVANVSGPWTPAGRVVLQGRWSPGWHEVLDNSCFCWEAFCNLWSKAV